ncbi:MAG: mechanosensitive ion channel family protein [Rhizobiales bacterium]|nr:mechanosensitive ion channel family protein [Rhizobacter sp.]
MTALLLVVWLVGSTLPASAQPTATDTALDRIRQQLDTAQQTLLAKDRPDDAALREMRAAALAAQTQAADIATELAPQTAAIEARIAEIGTPLPGAKEDADIASQRALLGKTRSALDAQVKLARLLAVEAEQLAAQLSTLRRSEFQARLGERTPSILAAPFWSDLRDGLPRDLERIRALGADLAIAAQGMRTAVWVIAPLALIAALWALHGVLNRATHWLTTRAPSGRLRRSLHAAIVVLRWTLAFGVMAGTLQVLLAWQPGLPSATEAALSRLAATLWFSGFVYGLASALLCADRPSWRLLPIPDAVATSRRWFPLQVTLASLVTWLVERLAALTNASLSTTVAMTCLVALALGLVIVLALMRAERIWRLELTREGAKARPTWLAIVAGLNWLVLVTAVVSLLAGYVAFGSFAVKQVLWVGIVLGSTYLIATLIDDTLMAWLASAPPESPHEAPASPATATSAGVIPPSAQIAVLLSAALRFAVLMVALMLLLAPFGEGPTDLWRRSDQWREGLAIGEFRLQPTAVLQALLVLFLGLTAVRVLRKWLSARYLPTTSLDPGMRASATSLFGYAGVVVAISLAMSAMGVGLERIAWVASALSVGIGFGLQAVVQNFVSGLILLAERPVKVGDWVSLGGVEGDIRRINVRATEIQMGDRSTVIVPNSEFITKIVRNVTLADPLGLVQIKLPVPLGSDAQQVRELLLAAFDANEDVLDAPAPSVLLDGIDHGQLLFNATGFAKSPRVTGGVKSALLFDMLQRLAEAGITLSAPPTMLINAGAPQQAAPAESPAAPL